MDELDAGLRDLVVAALDNRNSLIILEIIRDAGGDDAGVAQARAERLEVEGRILGWLAGANAPLIQFAVAA